MDAEKTMTDTVHEEAEVEEVIQPKKLSANDLAQYISAYPGCPRFFSRL